VKNFLIFLIFFFTALAQVTLVPEFTFFGAHPNLLLVLVVSWSVFFGQKALPWTLFSGVLIGIFGGLNIGFQMFAFGLISALTVWVSGNMFKSSNFLGLAVLVAVFTVFYNFFVALSLYISGASASIFVQVLGLGLVEVVGNAVLAVLTFFLVSKFKSATAKMEYTKKVTSVS